MTSRQTHAIRESTTSHNPYLHPDSAPMAALSDGTPLYPAYQPVRPGDRHQVRMRRWDGATGEWFAVTLDGRLYRQRQYWGNDKPRPDEWRRFKLA